jgi:HEAT repeat protein
MPTSDAVSWQVWWEFNKDPFLRRREIVQAGPVSGSDEFFLGTRRSTDLRDTLLPTEADRRERLLPALVELLRKEKNKDIATACLVALGKIGLDAPGLDLEALFAQSMRRDNQEIRETAVLALGISGRRAGIPLLVSLLRDDATGRRCVDKEKVDDRTRAFAAYALGLAARKCDLPDKQTARDALAQTLKDPAVQDRDLRTAVINGLGLLRPPADQAAGKRLIWTTVDALQAFYELDLGKGDQLLQAHVPIAIARLLGRGTEPAHQRAKKALLRELGMRERRHNAIYQSAAVALGMLCVPPEQGEEDAACAQALLRCYRDAIDQQARYFAVIALGRIGGAQNRAALLEHWEKANKTREKPWIALALGLLARPAAVAGQPDLTIVDALLADLRTVDNKEARAGIAIGLGLCRSPTAGPAILDLLRRNELEEQLAGYLCIALALLGHDAAVPELTAIVERSVRRPLLLQQAAVALGELGDKSAAQLLARLLGQNDSTATLAALAAALGQIGDRRSIDPLLAQLRDEELTRLARAFVAAALGGIGDKDPLPWNMPLSVDSNYAAAVDTLVNGSTGVLDIL